VEPNRTEGQNGWGHNPFDCSEYINRPRKIKRIQTFLFEIRLQVGVGIDISVSVGKVSR
jgi:hypothetical protein